MPLVAAAVITGVAGLGAAAISSSGASSAADAQTQAANQNNALTRDIYNQNSALVRPLVDDGNRAQDSLMALLGLDDDEGAARAAFDQFLGSTNYQFQVDEGVRAITGNRAARGSLDSGATLKALTQYGQDMGRGALGDYMSRLGDISTRGLAGINALTGAGNTLVTNTTNNNNQAADARSNAALASANAWGGALSNIGSLAGYTFGQSSYGKPPGVPNYSQGFNAANALVRGW